MTKALNQIDQGVKQAVAQAIEKHRRLGQSISIWQDGKVVILPSEQIPPLKQPQDDIANQ